MTTQYITISFNQHGMITSNWCNSHHVFVQLVNLLRMENLEREGNQYKKEMYGRSPNFFRDNSFKESDCTSSSSLLVFLLSAANTTPSFDRIPDNRECYDKPRYDIQVIVLFVSLCLRLPRQVPAWPMASMAYSTFTGKFINTNTSSERGFRRLVNNKVKNDFITLHMVHCQPGKAFPQERR